MRLKSCFPVKSSVLFSSNQIQSAWCRLYISDVVSFILSYLTLCLGIIFIYMPLASSGKVGDGRECISSIVNQLRNLSQLQKSVNSVIVDIRVNDAQNNDRNVTDFVFGNVSFEFFLSSYWICVWNLRSLWSLRYLGYLRLLCTYSIFFMPHVVFCNL